MMKPSTQNKNELLYRPLTSKAKAPIPTKNGNSYWLQVPQNYRFEIGETRLISFYSAIQPPPNAELSLDVHVDYATALRIISFFPGNIAEGVQMNVVLKNVSGEMLILHQENLFLRLLTLATIQTELMKVMSDYGDRAFRIQANYVDQMRAKKYNTISPNVEEEDVCSSQSLITDSPTSPIKYQEAVETIQEPRELPKKELDSIQEEGEPPKKAQKTEAD